MILTIVPLAMPHVAGHMILGFGIRSWSGLPCSCRGNQDHDPTLPLHQQVEKIMCAHNQMIVVSGQGPNWGLEPVPVWALVPAHRQLIIKTSSSWHAQFLQVHREPGIGLQQPDPRSLYKGQHTLLLKVMGYALLWDMVILGLGRYSPILESHYTETFKNCMCSCTRGFLTSLMGRDLILVSAGTRDIKKIHLQVTLFLKVWLY